MSQSTTNTHCVVYDIQVTQRHCASRETQRACILIDELMCELWCVEISIWTVQEVSVSLFTMFVQHFYKGVFRFTSRLLTVLHWHEHIKSEHHKINLLFYLLFTLVFHLLINYMIILSLKFLLYCSWCTLLLSVLLLLVLLFVWLFGAL